MSKVSRKILTIYHETKKTSLLVYLILRILIILCLVLQLIHKNYNNAFLCLLSLILLVLPFFIQKNFQITIPNTFEIIIMLFIFSAEILGEINNFYKLIPQWDSILHTLNGFLAAAVGFALIDLLNHNSKRFSLSPIYLTLVGFCFSMTIGIIWEFFEYSMDTFFNLDMQKDRIITEISSVELNIEQENIPIVIPNIDTTTIRYTDTDGKIKELIINGYLDIGLIDTMKDLIVNFIGAIVYSIFAYLYLHNKEKYNFISNFLVTRTRKRRKIKYESL